MPLPFIFAAATTVTTPQLDANFAALGALTAIPNTAAGTNAITMTPLANAPTVSVYENYQPFSFVAAATNTGAVTARYSGLSLLNVYKDSAGGPVLCAGSEIVVGNLVTLVYDTALNSGAGGFHLQTGPAGGTGSFLPLAGGTLTGPLTGTTATMSGNVRAAGFQVGTGNTLDSQLFATASLTWSVVAAGGSQDQNVTLAGVSIGDLIALGLPATIVAGVLYDGRVSASGVIAVRATNATSATVTPTAGSYHVLATRYV